MKDSMNMVLSSIAFSSLNDQETSDLLRMEKSGCFSSLLNDHFQHINYVNN